MMLRIQPSVFYHYIPGHMMNGDYRERAVVWFSTRDFGEQGNLPVVIDPVMAIVIHRPLNNARTIWVYK
jgi:hypothetical protein